MRTLTGTELTNLVAARVNHHLRVEIQSGTGAWVDFSSLGGIDWVDSCAIETEGIDTPVGTAQILLRRSAQGTRLAPFYGASGLNTPNPALDLGRRVRISASSRLAGVSPVYYELFSGRIDSIAWEQDPIVVDCSDEGAWLLDTQIETERPYVELVLTSTEFTTLTTTANAIVFAAGDPRILKGGFKVNDTVMLSSMPDAANNKIITVASLTATTIGTVETLVVNAGASATPVVARQSSAVENIMQQILDDNTVAAGLGAVALYVPVASGWQVRAFKQDRVRVLEALRALALQIGWEVRYKYDGSHAHRLTFFAPPRSTSLTLGASESGFTRITGSFITDGWSVDDIAWGAGFDVSANNGAHTVTAVGALLLTASGCSVEAEAPGRTLTRVNAVIGPTHYRDIRKLDIALADIRNVVTGKYVTEGGNQGAQTASDAASITKVGRRFMEISEDSTSNINSPSEMLTLVTAAANDLSTPRATHELDLLLHWPLQFGDFVQFTQNGEHYDVDQGFAVVGMAHTFIGGEGLTTLRTRGSAAGSYAEWLRREATLSTASALLPRPTITLETEGTSNGGADEGIIRVMVKFDARTDHVYLYASEAVSANQAAPEQSANRLAGIVRRMEGTIASSDTWETEFDIATTPNYYRKVVAVPIGANGKRGNPIVLEGQAVDAGTGPTGNVTGFGVVMSTVSGVSKATVSWTNTDADASIRIFRNGVLLKRNFPATTSLVDDYITVGSEYTYSAQAVRNSQTAPTTGNTSPPATPQLDPLTSFTASGGGPLDGQGNGLVSCSWSNGDTAANTSVEMAPDVAGSPGAYVIVHTGAPGSTGTTLNSGVLGATIGAQYWFRARATRTGYTSSAYSDAVSATFGDAA